MLANVGLANNLGQVGTIFPVHFMIAVVLRAVVNKIACHQAPPLGVSREPILRFVGRSLGSHR